LRSIWFAGNAYTPRRNFAVSKSLTASLIVGIVAFEKAGAHRVTLRADPAERLTADWRLRLALQAVENSVRLSEPLRLNRTVGTGTVRVPVSMKFQTAKSWRGG
jgi:hypothetical protein